MSRFLGAPDFHQLADLQLELDADLTFWDDETELYYTAPKGTVTDLASVPCLLPGPVHALLGGALASASAAIIHDAATRNTLLQGFTSATTSPKATLTRAQADALFYRALRATGYSVVSAYAFWSGVRLGGSRAWNRHRP